MTDEIKFDDFLKVDIRVAQIIEAQLFPKARVPSYRLTLDLGPELGVRKSCAHLPQRYELEELQGKKIICVINFPEKQIGPHKSQVLVLGVPDEDGEAILLEPERDVPLGGRVF